MYSLIKYDLLSIQWGHRLAGSDSPTVHPLVTGVIEGTQRKLARPVQCKQPLAHDTIASITLKYLPREIFMFPELNDLRPIYSLSPNIKKIFMPISDTLNLLMPVKGVHFHWKLLPSTQRGSGSVTRRIIEMEKF